MIKDYESIVKKSETNRWLPFVQFVFSLMFVQMLLFMVPAMLDGMNSQGTNTMEDSLRFRIVANSNSTEDQREKQTILQDIQPLLADVVSKSTNQAELKGKMSDLQSAINKVVGTKYSDKKIAVEFRNELFPPKWNNGFLSSQNRYEALVVTIGSGKGDNWWCSLFPKVCYRDQAENITNNEEVTPKADTVQVDQAETEEKEEGSKSWLWEQIKKLFD